MKKTGLGLGRGLDALIPENEMEIAAKAAINSIDIALIEANPWQPRTEFDQEQLEELAASIKSVGIIQPLTLRQIDNGRYQIIAGERRYRAAKMCGLDTVPAYIREANDDVMLQLALLENIQRADLNPIEEALSYQRLIDECQLTQEELSDKLAKKRSTIANFLRLLKLPAEIQLGLRNKDISMGHARALSGVDDQDMQVMLYQQIIEMGYSVRQVEDLVKEYNDKEAHQDDDNDDDKKTFVPSTKKKSNPQYDPLRKKLSDCFGTRVRFDRSDEGKGKITIPFTSDAELEHILSVFDQLNQ